MERLDLQSLLDVPGRATEPAVLGEIVLRHRVRRRRARTVASLGVALVLAGAAAVGATLAGSGHRLPHPLASGTPPGSLRPGQLHTVPAGLDWAAVPVAPSAMGSSAAYDAVPSAAYALSLVNGTAGPLRLVSIHAQGGVTDRVYSGPAPRGGVVVERLRSAGVTTGALPFYSCRASAEVVVEVSDRGFAGSVVLPVMHGATAQGPGLLGVATLGVAEGAPLEVAVLVGQGRLSVHFSDGRRATATAAHGVAVVVERVGSATGGVTLEVERGGAQPAHLTVPATGGLAASFGTCTLELRR